MILDTNALDNVLAEAEEQATVRGKGRPRSKVKKKQSQFYLPVDIVEAIKDNSLGNNSVFAEQVFRFYFDAKKIDY